MHWYKEKRSKHHIAHALIMSVVFLLGFSILKTHAVVNFLASNELGQFEATATPVETIAFDTADANNGNSTNAYGFNAPKKLALDTVHHRLFVSDTLNYRVLVFNLNNSNRLVDHQADFVIGQLNFTTNNLGDTDKSFVHDGESRLPLAYDEVHDLLFVGDHAGRRVLVFDTATITNGETAVRSIGPGISDINDVTNTNSHIEGIAVDMNLGYLYVSTQEEGSLNFNTQVQIYDIAGGLGTIVNGQMPVHFLGEDEGGGLSGGVPSIIFCETTDKGLCDPTGMAPNPGQGLFVADTGNNRVLYFDFTGGVTDFMPASHVIGASDFSTQGVCGGDPSTFCGALNSIAVSSGSLYVSDSVRLMRFDISGGISDAPSASGCIGQTDCFSQSPTTSQDGIMVSYGVAATAAEVWLADSGSHRVLQYGAPGGSGSLAEDVLGQLTLDSIYSFGTTPIYTQALANSGQLGGIPGNDVGFYGNVKDVELDSVHHRLFVLDTAGSSVVVYNLDTNDEPIDTVADGLIGRSAFTNNPETDTQAYLLNSPQAIAYDNVDNRLFVADLQNRRVLVFDTTTIATGGVSAINVLGKAVFNSNTSSGDADGLRFPTAVAYDNIHKRLFVADGQVAGDASTAGRIMVYDLSAGITDGQAAVHVLGQPDFSTYASAATRTAANFSLVYALQYDATNDRLFVADYDGARVLVFDTASISDNEDAVHVIGAPDFTTINSTPSASATIHPYGLSLDETRHQLYVSEGNTVKRFDIATITDGENALGILGSADTPPTQSSFNGTRGTYFSSTHNRLYVADSSDIRVMMFDFLSIDPSTPTTYSGTVGQAFTTTPTTTEAQGTVSFEVVTGTPPPGIIFGTSISGTPTVAGSYTFSIRALDFVDTDNSFVSSPLSITMNVAQGASGSSGGSGVIIPPSTTTGGTTTTTTTAGGTPSSTTPGTTGATGTPTTTTSGTTGSTSVGTSTTSGTGSGTAPGTTGATGGSGSEPVDPTTTGMGGSDAIGTDTGTGTGTTATTGDDEIDPPPYEDDCPGNLFNTVVCIVEDSIDYTQGTLSDTIGQIRGLMSVPSNDIISKLIGIVGILAGALFTLLPVLFTNPLSFSEILLLPARLWSLLLVAFGIKKRNRPWGRVYDSVTKQPLDPVYVSLQDNEGNEIASSITDIDGRYGFLVEPGKYRMIPKKTHYSFPSAKLIGKTRDELYLDLYFGYIFEVKEQGEVIAKNIPMDPDTFDWNEFAKQEQTLMRFYSKRDRVFARIADVAFSLGLTVSTIALIVAPTAYNITIFALYILLLVVKEVGFRQKSSGTVVRKGTDIPVPFAIVRIISKKTGVEVLHKVTNILGRYYALVGNGTYDVTIETKNPDGSYTLGMKKENVEIKNGLLKERLEV